MTIDRAPRNAILREDRQACMKLYSRKGQHLFRMNQWRCRDEGMCRLATSFRGRRDLGILLLPIGYGGVYIYQHIN